MNYLSKSLLNFGAGMPRQSKKASADELDLGLVDNEDFEGDTLYISDLFQDESLLSLEFQELKDIKLKNIDNGKGTDKDTKNDTESDERSGKEPDNLLKYAKQLLKKVKIKPGSEPLTTKQKKVQANTIEGGAEAVTKSDLDTQFMVTNFMVEELGNFGLEINVIQEIINEAKKFLEIGDTEAAEALIKNSKIFASNLWLKHRLNLISTTVSFIDTFILNQTELELDFKTANKYFAQTQEFLAKRDLTLANKYIDNTIQNVNKSWQTARKKKLKDAIKFVKFWYKELEDLDIDLAKLDEIIADAENVFVERDFDKTEYYLRMLIDQTSSEIKNLNVDVNQKEDIIQGIQGIYDLDNFSTLGEAISKAESMLLESQEKEKIQYQLNLLLSAYKIMLDMEANGYEITKTKDLFSNAKESFEKGDYETAGTFIKKIMANSKQMLGLETGTTEPKPENEMEIATDKPAQKGKSKKKDKIQGKPKLSEEQLKALPPEKRELFDLIQLLKKDVNFIKSIERTGEDIVKIDDMAIKAETAFYDDKLNEAKAYVKETQKIALELKKNVLKTKAEDTMESSRAMILEAHELGINVDNAERTLRTAEEHLEKQEFKAAINDAVQSQQLVEMVREKHQNASDKFFKIKLSLNKAFKKEKLPSELNLLLEKAEDVLNDQDYKTLELLSKFINAQVKQVQAGQAIDMKVVVLFEKAMQNVTELKESIKESRAAGVDVSKLKKLYLNAQSALQNKDFKEVYNICNEAMELKGASEVGTAIEKMKLDLETAMEELNNMANNGVDISGVDYKIDEMKNFINDNDLESAKKIRYEIFSDISTLNEQYIRSQEEEVTNLLETLASDIEEAKSDHVNTKETEDLLNYAKQRLRTKDFSDVMNILSHSHEKLNNAIQVREREKVEAELDDALETLGSIPTDHPKLVEMEGLLKNAKEEFINNEFKNTMDYIEQFLIISTTPFADEGIKELEAKELPEPSPSAPESPEESGIEAEHEITTPPPDTELTPVPEEYLEPVSEEVVEPVLEEAVEPMEKMDYDIESEAEIEGGSGLGNEEISVQPIVEAGGEDEELMELEEYSESTYEEAQGKSVSEPDEATHKEVDLQPGEPQKERGLKASRAEQLFKEAFGFIDKDRGGLYDREQHKFHEEDEEFTRNRYESLDLEEPEHFAPEAIELPRRTQGDVKIDRGMPRKSRKYDRKYEPARMDSKQNPRYPIAPEVVPKDTEIHPIDFQERSAEEYSTDYDEQITKRAQDRGERHITDMGRRTRAPRPPPIGRARAADLAARPDTPAMFEPGLTVEHTSHGRARGRRSPFGFAAPDHTPNTARERDDLRTPRKKRLDILKKEALRGLQEIQAIISNTYHFGVQVEELEHISQDARNAFEDGYYQEVLLYLDKSEELSRRLKIEYMDTMVMEIRETGENVNYLEYLIRQAEFAYNEERYKVGDELCRRFRGLTKELEFEAAEPKRTKIYCRYCGSNIPPDSTFCTVCGEKLW